MVELLLTLAISRVNVKPVAKALIARFRTLRGVLDAPIEELQLVKGIGSVAPVISVNSGESLWWLLASVTKWRGRCPPTFTIMTNDQVTRLAAIGKCNELDETGVVKYMEELVRVSDEIQAWAAPDPMGRRSSTSARPTIWIFASQSFRRSVVQPQTACCLDYGHLIAFSIPIFGHLNRIACSEKVGRVLMAENAN